MYYCIIISHSVAPAQCAGATECTILKPKVTENQRCTSIDIL